MSVRRRKRRKGEPREASSWRDVLKIPPRRRAVPAQLDGISRLDAMELAGLPPGE